MSDQQQVQGNQPYAGQVLPPGQYQQPAPKKKHTVRNVFLILALLSVLAVGGCMALLGGAVNEVSKEIDKSIAAEAENDKPVEVAAGKAFTHDDFAVDAGWTVAKDTFDWVTIEGARVTNDTDQARTAMLTFSFYKGKENLAEVTCTSNELQGGESSQLDCSSVDDFPTGYKTIKVADTF